MAGDDILTTVRLEVMRTARDMSRVPDAGEVSEALGVSKDVVTDAFRQLHDGHVVLLEPRSTERLRMANPFSAVPTPFRVQIGWIPGGAGNQSTRQRRSSHSLD